MPVGVGALVLHTTIPGSTPFQLVCAYTLTHHNAFTNLQWLPPACMNIQHCNSIVTHHSQLWTHSTKLLRRVVAWSVCACYGKVLWLNFIQASRAADEGHNFANRSTFMLRLVWNPCGLCICLAPYAVAIWLDFFQTIASPSIWPHLMFFYLFHLKCS